MRQTTVHRKHVEVQLFHIRSPTLSFTGPMSRHRVIQSSRVVTSCLTHIPHIDTFEIPIVPPPLHRTEKIILGSCSSCNPFPKGKPAVVSQPHDVAPSAAPVPDHPLFDVFLITEVRSGPRPCTDNAWLSTRSTATPSTTWRSSRRRQLQTVTTPR